MCVCVFKMAEFSAGLTVLLSKNLTCDFQQHVAARDLTMLLPVINTYWDPFFLKRKTKTLILISWTLFYAFEMLAGSLHYERWWWRLRCCGFPVKCSCLHWVFLPKWQFMSSRSEKLPMNFLPGTVNLTFRCWLVGTDFSSIRCSRICVADVVLTRHGPKLCWFWNFSILPTKISERKSESESN